MYLKSKVKIPSETVGVSQKKIRGITYVYYNYDRVYDSSKKYTKPKCTSIGKCCEDNPEFMYPNANFLKYFPEVDLPEEENNGSRSGCLRIGTYLVLKKIISEYQLDEMLQGIIGEESGLFLDLAAYSIITENNAGQYYPDYAYNHPLFTDQMKVYSDSKVSGFTNKLSLEQSLAFQDGWNKKRDHRQRLYVSYDSTNKNCQAGDIEFVEQGHPKVDTGAPVVNYSIAYDTTNSIPLFYEAYPGSIVDISQLQFMIEKANAYGYRHIGFILDRGYFSEPNIHYMDRFGYEFIIMMKGMKPLVKELVLEKKGEFEDKREFSIPDYKVNGTTVIKKLYPSDKKDRYFHIYFSEGRRAKEREAFEAKLERFSALLAEQEGRPYTAPSGIKKYFDLIYSDAGTPKARFNCAKEKCDVTDAEIALFGYFVIITSEKMTAEEAICRYKSRDTSEKLFRGDKSYLGNRSFRSHSDGSMHAKIFIEFVALIIRNRIHTRLKEQISKAGKKQNYMNVPAAVRELEKIEIIRQADGNYRLDHAVTATQKEILKAFQMDASYIKSEAIALGKTLADLDRKENS